METGMDQQAAIPRWRRVVRWSSALLLVLMIALFAFGQFRLRFADTCSGLPPDVACMRPGPLAWWVGAILAAALALAAINLWRHRPALLACGWLLGLVGFDAWMLMLVMDVQLFGRDTTLERAIVFTAGGSPTIFPALNLAVAIFLSLPLYRW